MEQKDQNFMLEPLLNTNKPTKLDKNPKFLMYCGSRKENIVSSEMPPCNTKSFQKFQIYNCSDLNVEKFRTDSKDDFEMSQNIFKFDKNSKRPEKSLKMQKELSKYRHELREFTNSTKDLEERNKTCGDFDTSSDSSATGNEYSLQPKCTLRLHHSNSFMHILSNKPLKEINYKNSAQNSSNADNHKSEAADRGVQYQPENKENMASPYDSSSFNKRSGIENDDQTKSLHSADVSSLKNTITKLQNDSAHFCSIIDQQKNTLCNYRSRFTKAQHLVKEQRIVIEQLNCKNQQLEKDVSVIIDELRHKIDAKLRDVNLSSERMEADQVKRDHIIKENCMLNERIQIVEAEAKQLQIKLEEMSRRKMATISRLKVAERDLKIFKNYNVDLKQEKRKLIEEVKSLNEQIDNMQDAGKRTMSRHREQNEKQRRQMQKRIFDLEMKLNRSQNSTTSLIQERDTLIAELQSQLNNLVHNFEVSQKHIRVLRRHIYSMCENNNRQSTTIRNRLLG